MSETTTTSVLRGSGAALLNEGDLPPGARFVDGAFREGASGTFSDIVDPATEQVLARTPLGTADEVDDAVVAAQAALPAWAGRTPRQRADVLNAVANRLEENADLLARVESANTGKPLEVSRDDVGQTIDCIRFTAGAARAGTSIAAGGYAADHLSVIVREPLGVVGAVTPWNYPLLMGVWKIAPILAAGNTLVLKPAESTPLSTLKLAELTADILPAGVLNVVTGKGSTVGARLAEHPDIAMIALTGSVNSGKYVAKAASDTLKRVHLELGGKAPVLVFADADLPAAASSLRFAGFWNAGQECGAACRVLVEASVAEEFVDHLTREVASFVVGEPAAGDEVEIGPMISREHYERVKGHLARAAEQGIRASVGGGPLEGAGFFIAPTVLVDVPEGAECATEEIFGPVITVETFETEDEAIRRANAGPYGLSASVYTENARRAIDLPSKIDAGTVWVNAHLVLASEMPWGGFKSSGYGRDLSAYSIDDYSRTKHVMHNHAR